MLFKSFPLFLCSFFSLSHPGIILGTGLSGMADKFDETPAKIVIPYTDIPYFAKSTVPGHAGNLVLGYIGKVPVICMQGRFHYYEGYTPAQVTYPVRVMAKMGICALIVSNAAGCVFISIPFFY